MKLTYLPRETIHSDQVLFHSLPLISPCNVPYHSFQLVTSPRSDSLTDEIVEASVDQRRPAVEPPIDEEGESRRRKEAFVDFALQLDQYAELKESRLAHQGIVATSVCRESTLAAFIIKPSTFICYIYFDETKSSL